MQPPSFSMRRASASGASRSVQREGCERHQNVVGEPGRGPVGALGAGAAEGRARENVSGKLVRYRSYGFLLREAGSGGV
jgi:hypothetical protein